MIKQFGYIYIYTCIYTYIQGGIPHAIESKLPVSPSTCIPLWTDPSESLYYKFRYSFNLLHSENTRQFIYSISNIWNKGTKHLCCFALL